MNDAALIATVDIGRSLQLLRALPDAGEAFMRGVRHVRLAHLAEIRDGRRTNRVERMVRVGFRKLAKYARTTH